MTSFFEVKFFLTAFTEECLGKLVKFFCGRQNLDKYGEKDSDENDAPNEFWIYLQGRINQGYDVVFFSNVTVLLPQAVLHWDICARLNEIVFVHV